MSIPLADLEEGMVIGEDIVTAEGSLLTCKGQSVTPSVMMKLRGCWLSNTIGDDINIIELGD